MINIRDIELLITERNYVEFEPDSSQLIIDISHSRGPAPDKALSSIKAALKPRPEALPADPSQVIFVIDKSGSMSGINFTVALRVFNTIFNALAPNTNVSILLFNDENQIMQILLQDGSTVTKGLKSEINFDDLNRQLTSIIPNKNTNIVGCLKDTAYLISGATDVKPTIDQINRTSIVFITDGIDNLSSRYKRTRDAVDSTPAPRRRDADMDMITSILHWMRLEYGITGSDQLPRIIPIGIGLQYDSHLLITLGEHPVFHRSGFIHITQPHQVDEQRTALVGLVNPYRLKSCLFVKYSHGESKLYPEIYLQESTVGVKEHLFDDTAAISEIYIIIFQGHRIEQISRILHSDAGPLNLTTLSYEDEILKKYLLSENAAMTLQWMRTTDKSSLLLFKPTIEMLLRNYTKAYWHKDIEVVSVLENLTKIYTELTDAISKRGPVRVINPLLDMRRRSEDEKRRHLASLSAMSATSVGPVASASASAHPYY